jgi:uncharacterized protein (DUF3084 family)
MPDTEPMLLSERDNKINKLKNVIIKRNKLLREIYKDIRTSTEENPYLKGVVDEYMRYYETIKTQKQQQLDSLNILVQSLTSMANSTNKIIRKKAIQDKNVLMREINKIKREMLDE